MKAIFDYHDETEAVPYAPVPVVLRENRDGDVEAHRGLPTGYADLWWIACHDGEVGAFTPDHSFPDTLDFGYVKAKLEDLIGERILLCQRSDCVEAWRCPNCGRTDDGHNPGCEFYVRSDA